ncbi:MAG TPA: hypothetical protein VN723_08940 [Rhizomicrobium sp.]|nr:hypothetical protein [Rhizomicrobium sp.]
MAFLATGPMEMLGWKILRTVRRWDGAAISILFLIVFGLAAPAWSALPAGPHESEKPPKEQPAIQLTRVQLGSWRTAIEAAKGWNRIQKRAGGAMDGLSPRVVPASLPGRGIFYRLWVGPVLKASASDFCARLQARRIDCVLAPRDAPVAAPGTDLYQASEKP